MALLGYGTFRFFIEFFREPDEHMGFMFDLMTMGQILCCAMLVAGVWMILAARGAPVAAEVTEGKSS